MILTFEPFIKVGEFELDTSIDRYLESYQFQKTDKDESGYESYILDQPSLSLFCEEDTIVSISCDDELLYKGRNLIGISIDEFISIVGMSNDGEIDELNFEDDGIPQLVYEFDEIGLQVWTKKGIIITIIASNYIEDDE